VDIEEEVMGGIQLEVDVVGVVVTTRAAVILEGVDILARSELKTGDLPRLGCPFTPRPSHLIPGLNHVTVSGQLGVGASPGHLPFTG
jgi:hypothetical protein